MKLGKLSPRHDDRTLRLANYHDTVTLAPPAVVAPRNVSWGMYANDRLGDCTCASAGHMVINWTDLGKHERSPAEADVIALYDLVNGGQDKGAVEIDVLNAWRNHGLGADKIAAYAAIDLKDHEKVKLATYLFGGCYIGLALPLSAQSQVGKIWTVGRGANGAPGSWGGHAVNVVGYDWYGLTVVTWGQLQRMSWGFWDRYCDEAYAVISPADWDGSVRGVNLDSLKADLAKIS